MQDEIYKETTINLHTSGSFCLKETLSLASSVLSQTILPSWDASTTPPELFVRQHQKHQFIAQLATIPRAAKVSPRKVTLGKP